MIKLSKDCGLIPKLEVGMIYRFRHLCANRDPNSWLGRYGYALTESDTECQRCGIPIDKKALFMYKLWRWKNDQN